MRKDCRRRKSFDRHRIALSSTEALLLRYRRWGAHRSGAGDSNTVFVTAAMPRGSFSGPTSRRGSPFLPRMADMRPVALHDARDKRIVCLRLRPPVIFLPDADRTLSASSPLGLRRAFAPGVFCARFHRPNRREGAPAETRRASSAAAANLAEMAQRLEAALRRPMAITGESSGAESAGPQPVERVTGSAPPSESAVPPGRSEASRTESLRPSSEPSPSRAAQDEEAPEQKPTPPPDGKTSPFISSATAADTSAKSNEPRSRTLR
jgi:hypothetical protein